MAVPGIQSLIRPVLEIVAKGTSKVSDIRKKTASLFNLTENDLSEKKPNAPHTVFVNNVAWALSYLGQADLITQNEPESYSITESGKRTLRDGPSEIDITYLRSLPSWRSNPTGG